MGLKVKGGGGEGAERWMLKGRKGKEGVGGRWGRGKGGGRGWEERRGGIRWEGGEGGEGREAGRELGEGGR